jgi:hypothetical protein
MKCGVIPLIGKIAGEKILLNKNWITYIKIPAEESGTRQQLQRNIHIVLPIFMQPECKVFTPAASYMELKDVDLSKLVT